MNEEKVEEASPNEGSSSSMAPPEDHILARLLQVGVPRSYIERGKLGFVQYVEEHPEKLQSIVSTLLTLPEYVKVQSVSYSILYKHCHQALDWLRWATFGGEPESVIMQVKKQVGESRSICGTVWGYNEIAYRCRTCECDPTCAICVSCFEAGDHSSHDYLTYRTRAGGCCDCGDITAWKESGFCSNHRGPGYAPPLPPNFQTHAKLVIQAFLTYWKERLQEASLLAQNKPSKWDEMSVEEMSASQATLAATSLLFGFCNTSESMLKFAAEMVGMQGNSLIELLLVAEHFLPKQIGDDLHKLLCKLMGDSDFKYQFATAYVSFYPNFLRKHLLGNSTNAQLMQTEYNIRTSFSVQIFTVPTITHRLVLECRLLDMLFYVLKELFLLCADNDGHFMVSRVNVDVLIFHLDDIGDVMNHPKVAKYVASRRPDLCRAWLNFLAYIQGMHPQRRIANTHIEEEENDWEFAWRLETTIANVHPFLVDGATCTNESNGEDRSPNAPCSLGTLVPSQVNSNVSKNSELVNQHDNEIVLLDNIPLSAALLHLISECTHVLHAWLVMEVSRESSTLSRTRIDDGHNCPQRRTVRPRGRMPREPVMSRGEHNQLVLNNRSSEATVCGLSNLVVETDIGTTVMSEPSDATNLFESTKEDWWIGTDAIVISDFCALTWEHDWPILNFDVSKQEVSFHIPLHRMLAFLLHRTLQDYDKNARLDGNMLSVSTLSRFFPEKFQAPGFAAMLMEHPLRLQVLCSQVQAGMWRRNGRSIKDLSNIYRSFHWRHGPVASPGLKRRGEGSLELDLFMLQCCAVMVPTNEFVGRILSCFGLTDYFLLSLSRPNEYEAFLARDFLILIIRIVTERGFCGLSKKEILRRDLIRRLAISDTSYSALVLALPPALHGEQLQETLDGIANYQAPCGVDQGKYVLKDECWKELDLYHPRWTLKELQFAEERYLHALKHPADFLQLPHWHRPYIPLQGLALVAVSGKIHDILRAVFFHAAYSPNLPDSRAPESLLFIALHLLSLGLEICQEVNLKKLKVAASGGAEMNPPLLYLAMNRICIGGIDGTVMTEKQSTLSLLIMLMQRYVSIENSLGTIDATSQCSMSTFIRGLLRKFSELHRGCMYEIETFDPDLLHSISNRSEYFKERSSSENSVIELKKIKSREHQAAAMAKMRAAQKSFASLGSSNTDTFSGKAKGEASKADGKRPRELVVEKGDFEDVVAPVCVLCREAGSSSPLCILTFAEKSRLLALAEKPAPSWRKNSKMESLQRRILTSRLPSGEQDSFITKLSQFIQGAMADGTNMASDISDPVQNWHPSTLRAGGILQSSIRLPIESTNLSEEASNRDIEMDESRWWEHNITMANHDSEDLRDQAFATVLEEYISFTSEVQSEHASEASHESSESRVMRFIWKELLRQGDTPWNQTFINDNAGLHLSTCGHCVHQGCLDNYFSSFSQRYYSGDMFEDAHTVDPDMGEFFCPVCRRLANSFLPILEVGSGASKHVNSPPAMGRKASKLRIQEAFRLVFSAEQLICKSDFNKTAPSRFPEHTCRVLEALIRRLWGLFYPEWCHVNALPSGCEGVLLWDVFRYALVSAELLARNQSFRTGLQDQTNHLIALEEATDASRGSVLPLLLDAAKTIQNQSRQAVLLRARGMQLLVGSVCHGVSREISEKSSEGKVLPLLQFLEQRQDSIDVQFWKRAADPLISHDPFSSFIWLFFCLPLSLPSSASPFTSLVHLFYLVCIVQGISHIGDLCKPGCGLPQKALEFLYTIIPHLKGASLDNEDTDRPKSWDHHPVNSIRRLTLPFLRRCALLQALCSRSGSVLPIAGSHAWEVSNALNEDEVELFELKELEELEKHFCIPPLSSILEDSYVQTVILKWSTHFQQKSHFSRLPRPVTAAPFRLMDLPHRFQDLIQCFLQLECPQCRKVPDQPALCLFCGVLCCCGGCCSLNDQSECTRHAKTCGAETGVFLMLRKTKILLIRSHCQALWPSPYLDAYGEEDEDMRRGKPLFLRPERYGALTSLVASHGLNNSIVRKYTIREATY